MYTIIGSDGNQYGPITAEQLHQWIREGRVNAATQVQSDGGDWKPLSAYAEFAILLGAATTTPTSTPAIPATPAPTATPSSAGSVPGASKTSGMAVTSLVLGILSMFCFVLTGLPSIILGFISMSKIKRSSGALKGKGLAVAGMIVSVIMMVAWTGGIVVLATKGIEGKNLVFCSVKVATLSQACAQYAREHDDTLPTNLDQLQPYMGEMAAMDLMNCPGQKNKSVASYEIVGAGQKVDWDKAAETPVIRETATRHMKMLLVGYLDGDIVDENTGKRLSDQ